jgi:hypothetical protein
MSELIQEHYLGDGVYASSDGHEVKLRAPRLGGEHVLFLKPSVWQALLAFAARIKLGHGQAGAQAGRGAGLDEEDPRA